MYNVYKITGEDTLEGIADRFATTVDELIALNDMQDGYLRVGDDLIVPDTSKKYFEYYTIQKGDSIYGISRKYNINPELLASLNGLNFNDYIYPGQTIMIPKSNYSYYITKAGDTIDSVANVFGVTRDKLLSENDIVYLLEGQLLVKEKN